MSASGCADLKFPKGRTKLEQRRDRAADAKAEERRVRLAVFKRDQKCRVCGKRKPAHLHHIVFRSQGGPTATWATCGLCSRCHQDVHAHLVTVSHFTDADKPNGVRFERVR